MLHIMTNLQLLIFSIGVVHSYESASPEVCSDFLLWKLGYVPDDMEEFKGICPVQCPKLKPHTVLNEWGDGPFLVCANPKLMFEYCAEYNTGAKRIQAHQQKCGYCRNFSNPCPSKYNSTESYKFRECFTGCAGLKTSKESFEQLQNYSLHLVDKNKQIADLKAQNIHQGVSLLKDKNKIEAFQDEIASLKSTVIIFIIFTVLIMCLYCKKKVKLHILYKYYEQSLKNASEMLRNTSGNGSDIEANMNGDNQSYQDVHVQQESHTSDERLSEEHDDHHAVQDDAYVALLQVGNGDLGEVRDKSESPAEIDYSLKPVEIYEKNDIECHH